MKHEIGELHQMQSLSLNSKVAMTITRVKGWLNAFDDQCYISFSGGKDSTVLVDIIHNKMGRTDIPLVFVDTGLECHLEKEGEGRFENMKETHPKQYEWIMKPWSEGGLGYKEVIDWINENGGFDIKY